MTSYPLIRGGLGNTTVPGPNGHVIVRDANGALIAESDKGFKLPDGYNILTAECPEYLQHNGINNIWDGDYHYLVSFPDGSQKCMSATDLLMNFPWSNQGPLLPTDVPHFAQTPENTPNITVPLNYVPVANPNYVSPDGTTLVTNKGTVPSNYVLPSNFQNPMVTYTSPTPNANTNANATPNNNNTYVNQSGANTNPGNFNPPLANNQLPSTNGVPNSSGGVMAILEESDFLGIPNFMWLVAGGLGLLLLNKGK